MDTLFLTVLRMSLSASAVILVVLMIRAVLRNAPKKWSYLLWSVVGFRLCCPVSFRSVFSLFAVAPTQTQKVEHLLFETPVAAAPTLEPSNVALPTAAPQLSAAPQISTVHLWPTLGIILWCAGMTALLIYSLVRILRLRSLLLDAVQLEPGVWQSDRIVTPFLMGLIHPKIYIPTETDAETRRYVLAHERVHLKRRDHWIKAFAFVLLMVHWFNPLCWLAFVLMSRDMELSCDERVLSKHGAIARSYSLSLLHFATAGRFPAPEMLAFGESDVKRRVKNALKWKRPKRWVTILAAVLCVAAVAACAANPTSDRSIAFIPDEVSSVMYSYLETCKNHPESIPSHMHFEYADEQEAYEKSYRKIVDYEILGAEKINDDLYAFTLRLEKEDDTHQKLYYFVGMIDEEWCVMLNSYNIPEQLQDGFDKDRFTLTSEDLEGGILVSPKNSESFQHDDPVLAVYHGFEVTESMVDYQKKMDAQRDPALRQNLTDKEIVDNILIGRMLLEEAEDLGLTATQEECDEMIASAKAAYALPDGKQMLDEWCADTGTTIDAYWAQLAAEAPDTISREKVRAYIKDSYRADHPDATDEEVEKAYAEYRTQLLQSHLDKITYYA